MFTPVRKDFQYGYSAWSRYTAKANELRMTATRYRALVLQGRYDEARPLKRDANRYTWYRLHADRCEYLYRMAKYA